MKQIDMQASLSGIQGSENRGAILNALVSLNKSRFKWFTGLEYASSITTNQKVLAGLIHLAMEHDWVGDRDTNALSFYMLQRHGANSVLYTIAKCGLERWPGMVEDLNLEVVYTDGSKRIKEVEVSE